MNKEELKAIIDAMNIEEIDGFTINYYDEKDDYYNNTREQKTISYNNNIEKRFYGIDQEMTDLWNRLAKVENNEYNK